MASILIRRLEESTKTRLRMRAASRGRSIEAEARAILEAGLAAESSGPPDLSTAIRRRFARFGGVEIPAVPREPIRRPPGIR